ncbi:bifunctional 4-hydroxy-2-oxoglutarate aldolase/2-dehydro-3-deoxy-phosphogluconate aldolase [Vulcanococcus sp. Clear-D1]|uniref:bifunctional 4-hydroxy-2-oxoglutarate aldolase/2-dehydro-3-deoxy-phosphogluconate aldolase n=1 Tax=Vulcanococcus sp. Clear-D1 TaxID=2766970 RepID=UPI0019CE826A|nr:bifunctional 4-hydroxy-2-oxoglutarate aldolase/2-dehydro-3-deoxy-phosphogluconate aldolase [Vulcanococcus sp. Clear-D1]MBD1192708.1 bifunctional 4-hydroxy-2-oxoglutarate aldolase/2-dehydro-3-deoxy-phosphogluconate aldolase [Vulcanococcus sp. Clear-D1]
MISGLHRQPLLAVLRPHSPEQARLQLQQLHQAGLCHAELAVDPTPAWVAMSRELVSDFPELRLGAASVRSAAGLEAALAAGLGYVVSPILDRALLEQASAAAITLVPGVFSPTEIATAVQWGAPAVKLYPAASLGPGYWRSLAGPLGPLPFCIAAGGLAVADAAAWYAAGVDAIALGGTLFSGDRLDPALHQLVVSLRSKCYP